MSYNFENKKIVLPQNDSFKISETLECGQCFRFEKIADEKYTVVAFGKVILLEENKDKTVTIYGADENDYKEIWEDYFDFKRDYNQIKELLSSEDETVKNAVKYAPGIRILNQDFFECLISFIISQNNRIPMIKKVVSNISQRYGKLIGDFNNVSYFFFFFVDELSKVNLEELMECKIGFLVKF